MQKAAGRCVQGSYTFVLMLPPAGCSSARVLMPHNAATGIGSLEENNYLVVGDQSLSCQHEWQTRDVR